MFSQFQSIAIAVVAVMPSLVQAFDMSRNDNVAVYWGQDSAGNQERLDHYCQDDSIDTIPLAFLSTAFGDDDLPTIDFSNICSSSGGSNDCSDMATDIKACQAKGKTITLSIGGATSSVILSGDSQGKTFADTIWNSFLGGSSDTRPFGDAILDGVDLDLESGDGAGYAAFVTQLRTHTDSADKTYYVTGAPQCPYPDAYIGEVLSSVGFDAVYVQFYNNPSCGLTAASTSGWNFATWDKWAKSSPNPDVKVYIGAPASSSAAGSGYVDADTLAQIAQENRDKYSSFGGVMLWDVSEAYNNDRFDSAIKSALANGGSSSSSSSKSASATSTSKSSTKTSTKTSSAGHASSSSPVISVSASISIGLPSSSAAASSPAVTPAPSKSSSSSKVTTSTRSHSRDFGSSTGIAASFSLGLAASSSASAAAPSSSSSAGAACGADAWSTDATYWAGDKVSYNGNLWTAKWWTVDNTPGVQEGDIEQVWVDNGSCDGSSASASSPSPSASSDSTSNTTTKRAVLARHARRFGRVSH